MTPHLVSYWLTINFRISNPVSFLSFFFSTITFNARNNCSLLNSRRLLKTVRVDSSKERLLQVHVIEVVRDLVPVALQVKTFFIVKCQQIETPEQARAQHVQSQG